LNTDNKLITFFTVIAGGIVAYLMLGHSQTRQIDVSLLPTVNALLNTFTTILLVLAYVSIKQKKNVVHKYFMISAMVTSTLFLVSYLTYHYFSPGPKLYAGEWLVFYRIILFSHIVLAALILPFILKSFLLGLRNKTQKHKQFVKYTFPIWLYVSVTGVVIYIMLYM
jgi:putative membrane protein